MGAPITIKTNHISLKHLIEQKIHTPTQHKGLSKLLGLDFVIEYKKECENIVVNSLSKREGRKENHVIEEAVLQAVTEIRSSWMENIKDSYLGDK